MAAISAILGTALAAGSAVANAVQSRNSANNAAGQLGQRDAMQRLAFREQYNQGVMDRSENRDMLNEVSKNIAEQNQVNAAQSAILGRTQAEQLALNRQNNERFNDVYSGIAKNASMLKNGLVEQYKNDRAKYYDDTRAVLDNASLQQSQASQNAVNAFEKGLEGIVGTGKGNMLSQTNTNVESKH